MSWWHKLLLGVDIEAEAARAAELNRRIAEEQRKLYERGIWTKEQYEEAQRHLWESATDPVEEVKEAFKEGLQEGAENIKEAVSTAGEITMQIIPSWFWLLIALGILGWFWARWK